MKFIPSRHWYLAGVLLQSDFTHCSDVSIVDFEQINTVWEMYYSDGKFLVSKYVVFSSKIKVHTDHVFQLLGKHNKSI